MDEQSLKRIEEQLTRIEALLEELIEQLSADLTDPDKLW